MNEEDVLSLSGKVVKELPTTEELCKLLSYDGSTGKLYWKPRGNKRWDSIYAGKEAGSLRPIGYVVVKLSEKAYRAHRLIWKMVYGVDPNSIDHIDMNKSNNLLSNLRQVSHEENMKNKKMAKNNPSGCTGVYWRGDSKKWRAVVGNLNRLVHLGNFDTFDEAVAAREVAKIYYGYSENHGKVMVN